MDTPILVSHFVCHSTPLSLPCQFLTMTNTKCPKMSQIPQKSNHKFIYKSPISSVLALPLLSISISMANKHRKTPTFQTQPTFLNIHTKTTQFWNQHKLEFHPKTHITFWKPSQFYDISTLWTPHFLNTKLTTFRPTQIWPQQMSQF